MIPATSNKGVFFWKYNNYINYLGFSMDYIIFVSNDDTTWTHLLSTFDEYFVYTIEQAPPSYSLITASSKASTELESVLVKQIILNRQAFAYSLHDLNLAYLFHFNSNQFPSHWLLLLKLTSRRQHPSRRKRMML